MVSLQEQFLKAGLVDKDKVKQVNQEKSRLKKVERRTGTASVDEARLAALDTQRKNAERAREHNAQRDASATQKAITAQISEMVRKVVKAREPATSHTTSPTTRKSSGYMCRRRSRPI